MTRTPVHKSITHGLVAAAGMALLLTFAGGPASADRGGIPGHGGDKGPPSDAPPPTTNCTGDIDDVDLRNLCIATLNSNPPLNNKDKNSLTARTLKSADKELTRGHICDAVHDLEDFRDDVQSLLGADGEILDADAFCLLSGVETAGDRPFCEVLYLGGVNGLIADLTVVGSCL